MAKVENPLGPQLTQSEMYLVSVLENQGLMFMTTLVRLRMKQRNLANGQMLPVKEQELLTFLLDVFNKQREVQTTIY